MVCGRHTLGVALRAGNAGPMEGAVAELERIVSRIRARWPGTEFVVRADAGYGKDELMSWCEARGVHYILGLAKNKRLVEAVGWELADAEAECEAKGRAAHRYVDFEYATRKSWSKKRRVVGKAEWLPGKANPRFVATSLPRSMVRARTLYEHLYCGRGRMENVIKEQQLDLFGERLSASAMAANQLRLLFSALDGALIEQLREALHNTRLARATAATLRAQLLKIGARVLVSVRHVKVAIVGGCGPAGANTQHLGRAKPGDRRRTLSGTGRKGHTVVGNDAALECRLLGKDAVHLAIEPTQLPAEPPRMVAVVPLFR